jgi:hypothetical protein
MKACDAIARCKGDSGQEVSTVANFILGRKFCASRQVAALPGRDCSLAGESRPAECYVSMLPVVFRCLWGEVGSSSVGFMIIKRIVDTSYT